MMMQYAFKMQFKHFHSLGLAKKGGSLNYMNLRAYTILIGYYGQNVSFMPCASRGWGYCLCVGVCVCVCVCMCVCVCVCAFPFPHADNLQHPDGQHTWILFPLLVFPPHF